MPWSVYIIQCKNGALYTGITTDLNRRFAEHKAGKGCRFTSYNPGKKLKYSKAYRTRSEALKREAEIKKMPRKVKFGLIRAAG
jgi:putative endonuclease